MKFTEEQREKAIIQQLEQQGKNTGNNDSLMTMPAIFAFEEAAL